MRPSWLLAALLLTAQLAHAGKEKKLTEVEQKHYAALKVFMDDGERKAFFKLKTEEERNDWLKKKNLWDRFYRYDSDERAEILGGTVQVGWDQDELVMAWGQPHDKKRLTGRPASWSELFIYKFEVSDDGYVKVWAPGSKTAHVATELYTMEITVDDDKITDMVKKDGWTL